jgi:Uma2 family endonuclease
MGTVSAPRVEDNFVLLTGVTWEQYEDLLRIRGDRSGVRLTYLDGDLELMSPTLDHESIKTAIARLLETYAEEMGLTFNGYGSWTVRSEPRARGVEPDECYVLGTQRPEAPDLAIEVEWTRGAIDKLEVYRGLGVREVWRWRDGTIEVHALRGDRYRRRPASALLPGLDLARLAKLAAKPDQTAAVRSFRAWLKAGGANGKRQRRQSKRRTS